MGDIQKPSSSFSATASAAVSSFNGVHRFVREIKKQKATVGRRRSRGGFSDSFSSVDLSALDVEENAIPETSPRGVREECVSGLEFETASSKASTSDSEGQPELKDTDLDLRDTPHWRGFLRSLKKGSQRHLPTFHPLKSVPRLTRRKSKRIREEMLPSLNSPLQSPSLKASFDSEFSYFKATWKNFTLSELQALTNNFSRENLIGQGGYAEVYKGILEDGQHVAIKRLTRGTQEEMEADFLSELGIIVHVDHPNIAKMVGYGVDGGVFLVLQLSPNGSLSSLLYGPRDRLDWSIRFKVAVGTAEGLWYLHEGCQRRIIHKDIKASNILLSEDFEAQICDFGLAKWLPDQWSHHVVSKIEGTFGYLPPEFFMHGIVDEKTDVYAYGVLLLELITGRQALDSSQKSLVMWAKPLLSKNDLKELVDPCLNGNYDVEQLNRVAFTASMCIDQSSIQRPEMSQVLKILKGDEDSMVLFRQQRQNSKLQRTYSAELDDADEYNSTKLLNDADQNMLSVMVACNSIRDGDFED